MSSAQYKKVAVTRFQRKREHETPEGTCSRITSLDATAPPTRPSPSHPAVAVLVPSAYTHSGDDKATHPLSFPHPAYTRHRTPSLPHRRSVLEEV